MPNVCCRGAAASAKPIAEQFPFVTIEPDQPRLNRCPTVPVAPRTATLRLRIAVKFDLSAERCGEPAVSVVDPAQQTQPGRGEVGQHLVVGEDAGALQIHHPAAAHSSVVLDLLVE